MVSQFNVLILVKPYFIFFLFDSLTCNYYFSNSTNTYISTVELHEKFIHVLSQYEIYHITWRFASRPWWTFIIGVAYEYLGMYNVLLISQWPALLALWCAAAPAHPALAVFNGRETPLAQWPINADSWETRPPICRQCYPTERGLLLLQPAAPTPASGAPRLLHGAATSQNCVYRCWIRPTVNPAIMADDTYPPGFMAACQTSVLFVSCSDIRTLFKALVRHSVAMATTNLLCSKSISNIYFENRLACWSVLPKNSNTTFTYTTE